MTLPHTRLPLFPPPPQPLESLLPRMDPLTGPAARLFASLFSWLPRWIRCFANLGTIRRRGDYPRRCPFPSCMPPSPAEGFPKPLTAVFVVRVRFVGSWP